MDENNKKFLINACKKMLHDKLQFDINEIDLNNAINNLSLSVKYNGKINEYNREILKLIHDIYKDKLEDNLDKALLHRELLRQQPVTTATNPIKTLEKNNTAVIPSTITVSLQPPKQQYFKTFVVQSIKRDWNTDVKRTIFLFEFPRFTYLIPFKICLPINLNIPSLRLKLINGNGKYIHFDFFKDANPLTWSTISELEPFYCDTNNKFTIGIHNHYDTLLDLGVDNIPIKSISKISNYIYEIELMTNINEIHSDLNIIANDDIYTFKFIKGITYHSTSDVSIDRLKNGVCLIHSCQLSIFFKYYDLS